MKTLPLLALLLCWPLCAAASPPGLPWTVPAQDARVLRSDHIASGPEGTTLQTASKLPLDLGLPDTRRAPLPPEGRNIDAQVLWIWWQAEGAEEKNPLKAASLYALVAPMVSHLQEEAHKRAAQSFLRGGKSSEASAHLAQMNSPDPFTSALLSLHRGELSAALTHLSSIPPSEETHCSTGKKILEDLLQDSSSLTTHRSTGYGALQRLHIACNDPKIQSKIQRLAQQAPEDARALLLPDHKTKMAEIQAHLRDARNKEAREALGDLLKAKTLSPELRCEAEFWMARVLKRTRKRKEARKWYHLAARSCTALERPLKPELQSVRTRALYWSAISHQKEGKGKTAATEFAQLLREDPHHRTADDALYHQAQMAEFRGEDQKASLLRQRMLEDYPQGDMTRKWLWKPVFQAIENGRWSTAEAQLEKAVTMPPDPSYYAQGRSWYYLGYAREKQGKHDQALEAWKEGFQRHPSAFYGQLSAWSLAQDSNTQGWLAEIPRPRHTSPIFFSVPETRARGWLRLGDFARAAREISTQNNHAATDVLWLKAYLHHLANEYPVSHNIARRQVPGFPEAYGLPTKATRQLWEIAFPDPYGLLVDRWGPHHGVDPYLMRSIIREESSFHPGIVSWAGAVGLMQLMVPTARGNAQDVSVPIDKESLRSPDVNIPVAARFLSSLDKRFQGHPTLMAAGYNAGPGAASKWRKARAGENMGIFAENIPYREARNYSRRVTGSFGIYHWLWSEKPLPSHKLSIPR